MVRWEREEFGQYRMGEGGGGGLCCTAAHNICLMYSTENQWHMNWH